MPQGRLAPGKEFPPAMAEPGRGPRVPIRGSTEVHRGVCGCGDADASVKEEDKMARVKERDRGVVMYVYRAIFSNLVLYIATQFQSRNIYRYTRETTLTNHQSKRKYSGSTPTGLFFPPSEPRGEEMYRLLYKKKFTLVFKHRDPTAVDLLWQSPHLEKTQSRLRGEYFFFLSRRDLIIGVGCVFGMKSA